MRNTPKPSYLFTSESVTEGHPDKVCDYIADSILDAYLAQDKGSRVACEVLCKSNHVILAGEISSPAEVNHEQAVRQAIREIGYTDSHECFSAEGAQLTELINRQSEEIRAGVNQLGRAGIEQGAGDQGIMFGYATDETPELMPLPILLAHRLARRLASARKCGELPWLRPDGKTQVTVDYEKERPVAVTNVLVSTQHTSNITRDEMRFAIAQLVEDEFHQWYDPEIRLTVNPSGSFIKGGPEADCGVTGRKIIVDTYGGAGRHGGGAFSGKDPSKVDRSGAYFCRYVARQLIVNGLARKAEIQVAYAIGVARPESVKVDTFNTGDAREAAEFVRRFDFRPAAIIERLGLLQPIYRQTTNYGHFGKPELPWERS
jgi:S-adenosylmethionine synthetase